MAKDFVIYKVHIHKVNHEELYSCSRVCQNPQEEAISEKQ